MKKNGFTLIELLAVIVILSIIALIATPIVLNIISDTKDSARLRSAEFYLDAVEMAIPRYITKGGVVESGTYNVLDNGNICLKEDTAEDIDELCDEELIVEISGETPIVGSKVTIGKGKVEDVVLNYNGRTIIMDAEKKNLVYLIPKSFAEDSWDVIVANVKAGNLSAYKVGDTKEVQLAGYTNDEIDENGNNVTTYTVRVANTSNPEDCNQTNFSQTACGFVIEFVDIIVERPMNSSETNKGGWQASDMREFLNDEIYNAIPEEIRNNIIETKVVSGCEYGKSVNYVTNDKLYLLSTKEVTGVKNDYDSVDETRQLDYYAKIDDVNGYCKYKYAGLTGMGSVIYWSLRSAHGYSETNFFGVAAGGYSEFNAIDSNGVSPAFRIG